MTRTECLQSSSALQEGHAKLTRPFELSEESQRAFSGSLLPGSLSTAFSTHWATPRACRFCLPAVQRVHRYFLLPPDPMHCTWQQGSRLPRPVSPAALSGPASLEAPTKVTQPFRLHCLFSAGHLESHLWKHSASSA